MPRNYLSLLIAGYFLNHHIFIYVFTTGSGHEVWTNKTLINRIIICLSTERVNGAD